MDDDEGNNRAGRVAGRFKKIISGGQTGVDRAALDTAQAFGLLVGGWCPLGRRAEDGVIPVGYPLRETPSADYAQRTAWNVRDSDGTLVLASGPPAGGTALTINEARAHNKPLLRIDLQRAPDTGAVWAWIAEHGVDVLNVAGPRESEAPGVYAQAKAFLEAVFGHAAPAHEGIG